MSRPSTRASLVSAAVLILVAALGFVAGRLVSGGEAAESAGSAGPETTLRATTPAGAPNAPTVPADGAYFGTWKKPQRYTQEQRIASIKGVEDRIGRNVDIVHTYRTMEQDFPKESDLTFLRGDRMLLLSWAGSKEKGSARAVADGRYDDTIRQRARAIKRVGKPVFVQWRWEMDRPNLRAAMGSPRDYIASWNRMRRIFAEENVDNAAWVWCPTASGFGSWDPDDPFHRGQDEYTAADWYPGGDKVDWICADAYPGRGDYRPLAEVVEPFFRWAERNAPDKPIMIGEYGVPIAYGERRGPWLDETARLVKSNPQVKALVYFDSTPDGHSDRLAYDLYDHDGSMAAFRRVAKDPYFNPRDLPLDD